MKFNGEIKFPDLDHPGVPVQAIIDDSQFEIVVEGESLGRWSLYDVEASRLVASAFLLKLDGEELTFVAADPIDFAYRGVEHMAGVWAQIKSKRVGRRSMAIRVSRKGVLPSRVGELRSAMEANLEAQARPRGLAGTGAVTEAAAPEVSPSETDLPPTDWDDRTEAGAIPVVGDAPAPAEVDEPAAAVAPPAEPEAVPVAEDPLAVERQKLAEERERLERERLQAEEREAVRLEAYRLEMERLEREREEARLQAELAAAKAAELDQTAAGRHEEVPDVEADADPVVEEPVPESIQPEPEESISKEIAAVFSESSDPEPAPEPEVAPPPMDDELADPAATPEPEVVDLSDLESGQFDVDVPASEPEPAMASAARDRAGLMGAVRSAFARSGGKNHEHSFLEAPGGLGITRYVCEDCGYVSISA